MKTLLLMSSLLLSPSLLARPIADLNLSGGFCPGTCLAPHSQLIIRAVIVTITRHVPVPKVEKRLLLTLDGKTLTAIQKDIRSIKVDPTKPMIDLDEGQPFCADIPAATYTIHQGTQKVDIAQDRDCHRFRLEDYQGTQLTDTLQNFLQLHYYTQQ